jgi:heterodisulfide reductase subunit C
MSYVTSSGRIRKESTTHGEVICFTDVSRQNSLKKARNRRRNIEEIDEKELWYCHKCHKKYKRSSTASIRLHNTKVCVQVPKLLAIEAVKDIPVKTEITKATLSEFGKFSDPLRVPERTPDLPLKKEELADSQVMTDDHFPFKEKDSCSAMLLVKINDY